MPPRRARPQSSSVCLQKEPTPPWKRRTASRRLTLRKPSNASSFSTPGGSSAPRQNHDQAVHSLALLEVLFDDLVDILRRGRPVPDAFGIDDHQRTRLAEAEAA